MESVSLWASDLSAFEQIALNLLLSLVILVVGWWISSLAGRAVERIIRRASQIDHTVVPIAQSVVIWAIRIFVIIAVLARFGVQTASIIAILGAAGLAIGLALQGTLQNIAAGIMLLVLRPLRAGEFVSVVGKGDGTVHEVGLFVSTFVQADGIYFTLPNSLIWGNPIINYSRNKTRRLDIEVGVRYGDDVDQAIDLLTKLVSARSDVLQDPAPQVMAMGYKESVVSVNIRAWANVEDYWNLRFDLHKDIVKTLAQAGFQMPVPARQVYAVNLDKKH